MIETEIKETDATSCAILLHRVKFLRDTYHKKSYLIPCRIQDVLYEDDDCSAYCPFNRGKEYWNMCALLLAHLVK